MRVYNRSIATMSLQVANILALANAFCAATGMSRSRLSTIVFNDGKKIDLLAAGADLYSGRAESAVRWFSDNWPERTAWPKGVQRPKQKAETR